MRCQANSKHASLKVKCNTYKELSSTIFFFSSLRSQAGFAQKKIVDVFCFTLYRYRCLLHWTLCMMWGLLPACYFREWGMIFFVLSTAQVRLSGCQKCNCARLFSFFFFFYLPFLNDLRWENLWASCSSNCDLVQRLSWSAFRSLCLSPGALIMSFYSFAICLTACFCDRHERMSLAQGLIKLSKNRYEIIYANQSRSKMAFFPPLYVPACLHPD